MLIISPLWLASLFIVGLAIHARHGRPILYASTRIGKGGADFTIWKLRTLDAAGNPIGRLALLLRKTHLDELPQLVNVITGSMSLVGPRPLEVTDQRTLPHRTERESLLPGITGPWQLERKGKHDYSEMETLDRQLVDNPTLWFRLTILGRTAKLVLSSLRYL